MHADELAITNPTVSSLVKRDAPDLAFLPLRELSTTGSTNMLYKLGDRFLVRLPRLKGGGKSIAKEARWTPTFTQELEVEVPNIAVVGNPGFGYPERWSIVHWLEASHPSPANLAVDTASNAEQLAIDLADAVLAFRRTPLPSAVSGELRSYRGKSLTDFDRQVRHYLDDCRQIEDLELDLNKAEQVWDQSLTLPESGNSQEDRWYHGDLVAENLLLKDGRLSAVIDFGGVAVGDPTVDLHGAWELFDASQREVFAERVGVSEVEWLRGRAWALGISLGAISYDWNTMPRRREDRLAMACNALNG